MNKVEEYKQGENAACSGYLLASTVLLKVSENISRGKKWKPELSTGKILLKV